MEHPNLCPQLLETYLLDPWKPLPSAWPIMPGPSTPTTLWLSAPHSYNEFSLTPLCMHWPNASPWTLLLGFRTFRTWTLVFSSHSLCGHSLSTRLHLSSSYSLSEEHLEYLIVFCSSSVGISLSECYSIGSKVGKSVEKVCTFISLHSCPPMGIESLEMLLFGIPELPVREKASTNPSSKVVWASPHTHPHTASPVQIPQKWVQHPVNTIKGQGKGDEHLKYKVKD